MKRREIENLFYRTNLIDKKVYFIRNDKIATGQITGYDTSQLFVGATHAIQNGQDFFFTIDELIESLKADVHSC